MNYQAEQENLTHTTTCSFTAEDSEQAADMLHRFFEDGTFLRNGLQVDLYEMPDDDYLPALHVTSMAVLPALG